MPRPARLSDSEVAARLRDLPGWSLREGRLHRDFAFRDFAQAWAFMTEVAREAEALGHHPDWSNSYSRVSVDLLTHDAGGITVLDFELAGRIQILAERRL
ncbi:MAG TPA: 4a-hydroxytetrahydrobiopterin dehydratase [Methylomirabilota bacterium]|nr:4a-hydroxytetrahydrobiopterin dehydratase [Methylomirabilota bacterium]